MKQAKVPHVIVRPDQQLNLLTAKARTGDRRVRAAEKKTRLAKTKLKSARRAYKLAKKALKKTAKLTKQAHKELVKWQKHSAKKQNQNQPRSGVTAKQPSLNHRKRVPAPKPPAVVNLPPPVVVPVATPTENTELPKREEDSRGVPQEEPTPDPTTTGS